MLVFGELRIAFGHHACDDLLEFVEAVLGEGGHGEHFRSGEVFLKLDQKRKHLGLVVEQVDLVDYHELGAIIFHQRITQGLDIAVEEFGLADVEVGIEHQHNGVGGGHALPGGLAHHLAQMAALLLAGMVHAGGYP